MKKLIQKLKNYFEHRRNYKVLKALLLKSSNECDFEQSFIIMSSLNTFKKEGCMYHLEPSDNKLYKVYPEVVLSDKPSIHLKNKAIE